MDKPQTLRRFLTRLTSRSVMSPIEQEAILGLSVSARKYRTNHDIVSPKTTVEHACLIAEGIAARYDQSARGQRQITALYLPGDMGDLHSVVSPKAAWGIVALMPVEVLEVPHRELMSIAMRHPTVGMAFWRDGTADASILAKWAANARRSARSRLAHLMCEIGLRSEMAKLGTRTAFHFPVSQHQLADIVGLTAVHVNRTLQALRSDGLIRSHQGTVFVDDLEGLRKVADFDDSYLLLGLAKGQ